MNGTVAQQQMNQLKRHRNIALTQSTLALSFLDVYCTGLCLSNTKFIFNTKDKKDCGPFTSDKCDHKENQNQKLLSVTQNAYIYCIPPALSLSDSRHIASHHSTVQGLKWFPYEMNSSWMQMQCHKTKPVTWSRSLKAHSVECSFICWSQLYIIRTV